jgi:adenine phosphoribosyltransferase
MIDCVSALINTCISISSIYHWYLMFSAGPRSVFRRIGMESREIDLKQYLGQIPDWPKKGVLFIDVTPLMEDSQVFPEVVRRLCEGFKGVDIDYVAAVEARGFIFGSAVALALGVGFVPVRKKGKLPGKTESITYDLEYGQDTLEIHKDVVSRGSRILIVDDLIATGGTLAATCELIEKVGGVVVGISCLLELPNLKGRDKLTGYDIHVAIEY